MNDTISAVLPRMLQAVDTLDWLGVRATMTDKVRLDYTSLFGGDVETLPADEVIARWQGLLPGFDATQHLTGPVVVLEQEDDEARCRTTVRGYHVFVDGQRPATWMVAGSYDVRLRRSHGQWKIAAITLESLYEEGDRALTEQAAERVAALAGGRAAP